MTQVNVPTITIGGKERPLKFGTNALRKFADATDRTLADIDRISDETLTLTDMVLLTFHGLKEGARIKDQEFNHSPDDVGDWIDDMGPDEFQKVIAEYVKSRTVKKRPAAQAKKKKT